VRGIELAPTRRVLTTRGVGCLISPRDVRAPTLVLRSEEDVRVRREARAARVARPRVTVEAPAAFVFTPASLPLFGAGLSRFFLPRDG
jgi:hypothetical protein